MTGRMGPEGMTIAERITRIQVQMALLERHADAVRREMEQAAGVRLDVVNSTARAAQGLVYLLMEGDPWVSARAERLMLDWCRKVVAEVNDGEDNLSQG